MKQAREALERLLRRFLIWRAQNLDTSTFLVLVAVVTGLVSGLVAVVDHGQWVGFLSKAKLFEVYRRRLREVSQEA
jgi:hypothetical protein